MKYLFAIASMLALTASASAAEMPKMFQGKWCNLSTVEAPGVFEPEGPDLKCRNDEAMIVGRRKTVSEGDTCFLIGARSALKNGGWLRVHWLTFDCTGLGPGEAYRSRQLWIKTSFGIEIETIAK
jgi:hypothetical protein